MATHLQRAPLVAQCKEYTDVSYAAHTHIPTGMNVVHYMQHF